MKVLITGGYGFIGSHVAERFHKEGYEVYIIDNLSTGSSSNVEIRHKFYPMNVQDQACKELFSNNQFDVVVHLAAQVDATASMEEPCNDARTNIVGLINMLNLSGRYGVKKFIFASSAAVYGDSEKLSLTEEDGCLPMSPYGAGKYAGEQYCKLWKTVNKLDTISLRFSNVYGPRQSTKGEGGVIATFMDHVLNDKVLSIHGSGQQTRDFIYVEDVVDAVYKSAEFCHSDVLNISSDTQVSVKDLAELISSLNPLVKVEYSMPRNGDIMHSRLSNAKALSALNWVPIYTIERGIEKTYKWYKSSCHLNKTIGDEESAAAEVPERDGIFRKLVPYIENILAFLIVFFLHEYSRNHGIPILIDMKLVYIIIFGIMYGLKQTLISVFLSCALFLWEIRGTGSDIISLIYNINALLHFSMYIFVGSVLGYSMDSKKYRLDAKEDELKDITEKFDYLYEMYNESKVIRKELQDQLTNTQDSFGKIYKVISVLDTLEPDRIFGEAVGVMEQVIKSKDIYIYSVSKTQDYLRLVSKSKGSSINAEKSIKVSDFPEIENLIRTKGIYVNRDFDKTLPVMAAPIVLDNKVLAIICVYSLKFETITLYKQNLLKIVSNLITSSLTQAYQYDQAIYEEKYIKGTRILKKKHFDRLLQNKIQDKQNHSTGFVLLRVSDLREMDPWSISRQIEKNIRDSDYMGVNEKEEIHILLSNTSSAEARHVIDRLTDMKINIEVIEEDEYHEVYNDTLGA